MVVSTFRVAVRTSNISGNGLFATENVLPGELLFSLERPLISAVDKNELQSTCSNCFARARVTLGPLTSEWVNVEAVKACVGCRVLYYCSKVRYKLNSIPRRCMYTLCFRTCKIHHSIHFDCIKRITSNMINSNVKLPLGGGTTSTSAKS